MQSDPQVKCICKPGIMRDNCPSCEGTGQMIDFRAIRNRKTQEQIRESITTKFSPIITGYSPFFRNVLQVMLGNREQWVTEKYCGFYITSDGFFLGRTLNSFKDSFIGRVDDLTRNLNLIINEAKLDSEETAYLNSLPNIQDWRKI